MSSSPIATALPWVASLSSVQDAVARLLARRTHQHFIGYLYVRKIAGESGLEAPVKPKWASLDEYLRVEGGPHNRPLLRPFWHGQRNAHQEWMNENLAGSFAPSSIRTSPTNPLSSVVTIDPEGNYTLRNNHAENALQHLLLGQPMSVVPLALFLYRNRGIWSTDSPTIEILVQCFRDDFGYSSADHDQEFRTLYSLDPSWSGDIFEPLPLPVDRIDESERIPGHLTERTIRHLTAADLGLDLTTAKTNVGSSVSDPAAIAADELMPIPKSDQLYIRLLGLLEHYGGVVFVGPSGTGKSYYARRIALALADGDPNRYRFVQFHPSYQYEDFVEGFRPNSAGTGFTLTESHFLQLCRAAIDNDKQRHVLVIDELSRGDPGRVFGEALTYLELSKRGMPFHLASGKELEIPRNLLILATMNDLDYGADQVDAAFNRRFAKIRMYPDAALVNTFLENAGMSQVLRQRVCRFFDEVNALSVTNPYASLGHTYFVGISDIPSLQRLWDHQLEYNLSKAFPFDTDEFAAIRKKWNDVVDPSPQSSSSASESENPDSPRI